MTENKPVKYELKPTSLGQALVGGLILSASAILNNLPVAIIGLFLIVTQYRIEASR